MFTRLWVVCLSIVVLTGVGCVGGSASGGGSGGAVAASADAGQVGADALPDDAAGPVGAGGAASDIASDSGDSGNVGPDAKSDTIANTQVEVLGDAKACSEGSACDDGNNCTKGDSCKGGQCVGTPLVCDKGLSQCKVGSCEPANGVCLITDKQGSCSDGDPCTETDYCLVGACVGFKMEGCCTPKCTGKLCGDDGCGQPCGTCTAGQVCGNGACVASSAAGETCADAKVIPTLPYTHAGTTLGAANDLQAPTQACYNGALGTYGPDVVYRYTATNDITIGVGLTGYSNKPSFFVVTDCADIKNSCLVGQLGFGQQELGPGYATLTKGQTAFIVVDADSTGGEYTLNVTTCAPSCAGKQCGSNGCGGVCGYCQKLSAFQCSSVGTCLCVPNCYAKKCGGDGCGGSCGSCSAGTVCDADTMAGAFTGNCVKPNQVGDTCAAAIPVVGSPFSYSGSTVGLGNNVYGWSFCEGNGTGAYYGDQAPDMLFAIGGAKSETWHVELTKKGTSLQLYAITDCTDPISCKQAAYKPFTLKTQLLVESPSNAPIFVAVDGYSQQSGTFTLDAKKCTAAADCPAATVGEYCSLAVPIAAVPFKASGSLGLHSYFLPKGACGAPKDLGKGGGNVAYALPNSKTTTYTVKVVGTGGMDPIVYAAKDCTQLATTCGGYADKTGEKGTETLAVAVKAGEAWFVVVDAPSDVNGSFSIEVGGN